MKGFDVAQGIPAIGEAAIHEEVLALLTESSVPYTASKVPLWGGRSQADFVQAVPTLLLFGNVSRTRWDEIKTTCLDQRAQVLGYRLLIEGEDQAHVLTALLERS